ncbi:hypothetical protein [Streptomyces sp. NPDC060194]|uniref:hypothetical protein n=1 Tax=Streptomyces sp. NPDC060194 TaxID=3347069 RepID=UPI00365904CF
MGLFSKRRVPADEQRYPGYQVSEQESARRRAAHRRSITRTARKGDDWQYGPREGGPPGWVRRR